MRVVLVGPAHERRRLREQLPAAIEVVAEYETAEDATRAQHHADVIVATPSDDQVEHLTPRESQVLALLAEGLSNKGIADRLAISDQTVKFHVASIIAKLGATNRTDAVRRAVRRGVIDL